MMQARLLLPTLWLATTLAPSVAAQTDPPPDVPETVEQAIEDTADPAALPENMRVPPETMQSLQEMFGTDAVIVVDDPQDYARKLQEAGADVEVITPGLPQIERADPAATVLPEWLDENIEAADWANQHQREQQRRRAALRFATGAVIVIGILVLMLRKPWESKELPKLPPEPPEPEAEPSGEPDPSVQSETAKPEQEPDPEETS